MKRQNTLENMELQRDIWRDRALNDRAALVEMKEAAERQHGYCKGMERAALEAVQAGAAYAALLDAIMSGTTGIGGAL